MPVMELKNVTKTYKMAGGGTLNFDFIGGHPMAGSHKSGIQASDVNLFENACSDYTKYRRSYQRRDLYRY